MSGSALANLPYDRHVPSDTSVRYTMHLGAELLLEFEVISGGSLIDVETLLHTYLAVPDVEQVTISGLDQSPYWDLRHLGDGPGGHRSAHPGDHHHGVEVDSGVEPRGSQGADHGRLR
ncbi:Uncharacterised protein [Mycobacteroides abscessus subsp. abscessus]|nr:Uncharacterised protein [Mycobacteroides abscessus subsp. abscessus]